VFFFEYDEILFIATAAASQRMSAWNRWF